MTEYTTRQCPVCHKEFIVRPNYPQAETCSISCGQLWRTAKKRQPPVFDPASGTYAIPLTREQHTIVDASDVDLASNSWYYAFSKRGPSYAARRLPRQGSARGTVWIHRLILERIIGRNLEPGEMVDHIDGNGLNNRRANLRLANAMQNQANRGVQANNRSGFKGVSWSIRHKRWFAFATIDGKCVNLGGFDTPEAAHKIYAEFVRKHLGEFANDGSKGQKDD